MVVGPLNISEPITGIFGETITITCSVKFVPHPPPAVDVNFEWFFDSTLPTDVTKSNKTRKGNTYSSTLQFSPLLSAHAGIYTCHFAYVIGGNKSLTASTTVSVSTTEMPTTLMHSTTSDAVTESLTTVASDVVGNSSNPNSMASNSSSNIAVIVTAVCIMIFTAAIVAVIIITVIVYR